VKDLTIQLFDYHVWANEKLLQHLRSLPREVFTNKVDSVFPTIAETLGHILAVDELWFSRIKGENLQQIVTKQLNTLEETIKVFTGLYNEIKHFLVHTENHEKIVIYKNTKGDQFSNKISEIVQHIVNHGTYHRGNISAMIRQMGYEGISADYIGFLRKNQ
jgi:uncharacterized damage-inducible protein DinB